MALLSQINEIKAYLFHFLIYFFNKIISLPELMEINHWSIWVELPPDHSQLVSIDHVELHPSPLSLFPSSQ